MPKTYTNPVWNADFPDPFVIPHNKKFYAYATETHAKGSGFQVMESSDLVHWEHKGLAYTPPWSKAQLWAPEVHKHPTNGKFYLTHSALHPVTNKRNTAIAMCASPLGPFEHKSVLVEAGENKQGVIDATIFTDTDGVSYLLWSEEEPRAIVIQKLAPDWLSVTGEKTTLLRPDMPWEQGVTEAPTLIRRGNTYHLIYSANGFETSKRNAGYCVAHATSTSIRGPYERTGAILAQLPGVCYGPGHQCVVKVQGQDWMLYHGWDDQKEPRYGSNPIGRTLRLDKIVWEKMTNGRERPRVLGPTCTPQPAPVV
jgi:beta-xylosidase